LKIKKIELEEMTRRKQATLFPGELLQGISEDSECLVYTCNKHPDHKIQDWYVHVMSFSIHPEIKENNPTHRRRIREQRERDLQQARPKLEREYDRREAEKEQIFGKQGFVRIP
jgi:hypothetical protein